MSSFFWGYMPAQVVGGFLSDKYGGEVILGFAAVGWAFLTLSVPFIASFPVLFMTPTKMMLVARMCTGLSQGQETKFNLTDKESIKQDCCCGKSNIGAGEFSKSG